MAKAMIVGIRGSGRGTPGTFSCIATCYFFGDDVAQSIEGQPYEVTVTLASSYTLGDLKSGLLAAAQAKATDLGLALLASEVDVPGYDNEGQA